MTEPLLERLQAALVERYLVERELGRGGMATVYLAEDLKHARHVAVKVLRSELAAALGPDRFLREIKLTAQLNHPHILPLLESGEAAGVLYYVMPYVDGESLRQRLNREKRLSLADAFPIIREVADALDSAHKRGVVHRDIKPENILLQEGHAVISDFGIARAITQAAGDKLTETGLAVGTPSYMSPEQASGEPKLDGRSDIYSLACVLYEMLAGQPPFTGSNAQAVLVRHLTDPVPDIGTLPRLPPPAAEAIMRALAKTPGDRFPTAGEFVRALVATQGPRMRAARLFAPIRQSKLARPAALLVALLGLAVVSVLVRLAGSRPGGDSGKAGVGSRGTKPAIAVVPFENASPDPRDAYLANGVHQEIISHLGMIGAITVIERGSVMRYRDAAVPINTIATELGVDFVLRGSLRKDSARVRFSGHLFDARSDKTLWSQEYDRDLSAASLSAIRLDVARRVAEALQVGINAAERGRIAGRRTESAVAYSLFLRAGQLEYQSDAAANVAAAELLTQACALDSGFASGWAELANVYVARSYTLGESRTWADSAITLARRAIQLDRDLPSGYRPLGRSYLDQGRLAQAAEVYSNILELRPNDGDALLVLGWLDFLRGRLAEAMDLWLNARAVDPMNATVLLDLSALHRLFGDDDRADQLLDAVTALGPGRPYIGGDPIHIGGDPIHINRLLDEGRNAQALAEAERSLSTHPRSFPALATAADASLRAGDYQRAREHFDEMRRIAPDDWNYWGLTYRTSYAYALIRLGQQDRAGELLQQTLQDAMRLTAGGDERPGVRREIAAIHAARGEREEAYAWFTRAVEAGWRLEAIHPSPLFEPLRGEPRFRQLRDRIDGDILSAKVRVERLGLDLHSRP